MLLGTVIYFHLVFRSNLIFFSNLFIICFLLQMTQKDDIVTSETIQEFQLGPEETKMVSWSLNVNSWIFFQNLFCFIMLLHFFNNSDLVLGNTKRVTTCVCIHMRKEVTHSDNLSCEIVQ